MQASLKILPIVLYFIVGAVSFMMALKSMMSHQFLPFHEKAAGRRWEDIDESLKQVILSLLRLSGLGFLVISILLTVFPVFNYFYPNYFYRLSIPVIACIYCAGLFLNNYILFRSTKAGTPWKGSLTAMVIIIIAILISFFD